MIPPEGGGVSAGINEWIESLVAIFVWAVTSRFFEPGYPPANAPTTQKGSAPDAIASGSV